MPGTDGVEITGPAGDRYDEILTPGALALVARLQRELGPRRKELLAARATRQQELIAGGTLDFLAGTRRIRDDKSWRVAPPAPGLVDRRVEITGPTDKKMTINALNSGAKVWLADFEDANTPLWDNMVTGQLNLKDALDRKIGFTSDEGKSYQLRPDAELATIVVRPRGWHLEEKHVLVDGERISGSLFDFALYFFHCAQRQLDKGKGPYFYLAKIESHTEARLWNDAFNIAQDELGISRGSIRATVLIETIPAAFEMQEILYELREHSSGLNAGRWDYLFSIIKKFRTRGRDFVLPERNAVTMTAPFMRAYTELLVSTCHGRGAHAMGGMAAFIPSRRDAAVNATALAKVRDDKTRESRDGFDGSWVAHPDLVPVCREVFDGVLGDHGVAVPGQLAGGQRRGGDLQPDGGRGDGGDLAVPGLAVAAQRHQPGRGPGHHRRPGAAADRRGTCRDQGALRRRVRPGRVRRGGLAVCRGGARRRLRGVPHAAGLRADALTPAVTMPGRMAHPGSRCTGSEARR